jgi:hypothetical protein
MSLIEDIETYLVGRRGSTRRRRYTRRVTPEVKAYRERGSRKDREEE